jgi:hypothetical protein
VTVSQGKTALLYYLLSSCGDHHSFKYLSEIAAVACQTSTLEHNVNMFLLHKFARCPSPPSCCASQLRGARSLVTAEPSGLTANDDSILAFALQVLSALGFIL